MKPILSLSCALLIFSHAFSQKKKTNSGDVTDVVKITFINPGFSYEGRIGKLQTIYGQAFMNVSSTKTSGSSYYGESYKFYFDPAVTLQYRYYYNYNQRSDRGRRTEMNSLNYIAPVYEGIFSRLPLDPNKYLPTTDRRLVSRAGFVWGMQRNYQGRFSLDLNLGLGAMFAKSTYYTVFGTPAEVIQTIPTFMGQINIGLWLNGEKEKK
jgi:hypothetical protein